MSVTQREDVNLSSRNGGAAQKYVVGESTMALFLGWVALGMASRCANNSGYLPKWAGSMVPKLRGKATC